MNNSGQSYHRQHNSSDSSESHRPKHNNMVNDLLRSNANDLTAYQTIRANHNENETMAQFEKFKDEADRIRHKANQFKHIILTKYGQRNMTSAELVKKAKKYAKKANISDSVFETFVKMVISEKNVNMFSMPFNEMSKTFNYTTQSVHGGKLRFSDKEIGVLQEILKIYQESQSLYSHVCLQTLSYQDDDYYALNGKYVNQKNNPYTYIHPIIVAMFFPKIKCFEDTMLLSNIARLVKMKNEGSIQMYQPDVELMLSIIHDPNVINCVEKSDSPLSDLRNRALVQVKLWEVVFNLRHGKYFTSSMLDLIRTLNNCANGAFDMPDLTFVRDEGTILRRLLQVFSFRPTYVSFVPSVNWPVANQFAVEPSSFSPYQLTPLPMVTIRLPHSINKNEKTSFNLSSYLSDAQWQWHYINKTPTLVSYQFVFSRDVVIFYIPRRFNTTVNIASLKSPFKFQTLPVNESGIETLNSSDVQFDSSVEIANDLFSLKSVVYLKTTEENIINGVNAAIIDDKVGLGSNCYIYDPLDASKPEWDNEDDKYMYDKNVISVYKFNSNNIDELGIEDVVRTHGTIFIYTKVAN
jgi:hypothetical protein